ncbi:LysR family transcriptional regulator [Hoeflea alexandrii]|uniref:LysR family transcriptional regulator n=1 Tax=Hoeflea alexandrii TaxID=288436 RepID=UPI0035D0E47E
MKHLVTFRMIDAIARTGSIRSAAEQVNQTPSAVQRRLQNYEDELGYEIFQRTSKGVRLNAAGEMAIQHIRQTLADTERLNSLIADLAGVRRGHVNIGCSQALMPYFLPTQIARYQARYPEVTFNVQVMEHSRAAEALEAFQVDIALVFDEKTVPDYEVHLAVPQRLAAIMARDHPLARHKILRLRQCYEFPVALALRGFSGRLLLERALHGKTFRKPPIVQSDSFEYLMAHVATTDAITFQIQIGAPDASQSAPQERGIISREIDTRDVTGGMLLLGLKRNRALPVAASRFVEQITLSLSDEYRPSSD